MERKSSFIVAASLIIALLLAVTAGCSDPTGGKATGGNQTPVKDVTAVKILRDGKEVKTTNAHAGDTVDFTAKVTVTGGADDSVTWKVAGKKASGTNINGNGRLTIGAEPTGIKLTVTATSTVKKTVSRSVTVQVVAAGSRTELVISWPELPAPNSGEGSPYLAQGDTLQLYVEDENGNVPYVLWEIISEFYSEGTYIDDDGILYIGEDETADSVVIRVTSMENEDLDLYSEEEITIIKVDPPEQPGDGDADNDNDADGDDDKPILPEGTLTIGWPGKPAAPSIAPNQTLQFTVEASNPALLPVTWAITSNGNNAGTNINNAGLLTVAANETLTSLTIRATSNGNNTVSATQAVTITQVAPQPGNFTITYGPFTGGGTVTGPATASRGDFVQITITPNNDHRFQSVTITKTGPETGDVQASGTGDKRTFIMPESNVSVTAVFVFGVENGDYFSEDFNAGLCSFYDKFDGTGTNVNARGLDRNRWGYDNGGGGFGNGETQYYDGDSNARVNNGILSLILEKKRTGNNDWTSAKVWTSNGAGQPFSQTYGRFEAKIRMVSQGSGLSQGMWPAFWMMPVNNEYYGGGWPRGGEIDIMEMKGRLPRNSSSTLHWRPNWPNISAWQNQYRGADVNFPATSTVSDWHVYGVRWERDAMIFLFDGMEHVRITRGQWHTPFYDGKGWPETAPFDRPFYLILNFACGGQFDNWVNPTDASLPATLDIDWVRVYTLANDPWIIKPLAGSGYTARNFNN